MAGPLTASIYSTSVFMGHPKDFHCGSLMIFTLQIKIPMALNYKSEHKSLKKSLTFSEICVMRKTHSFPVERWIILFPSSVTGFNVVAVHTNLFFFLVSFMIL